MRNRKKRKTGTFQFFTITAAALALPVLIRFCVVHLPALEKAGENAAILSAALAMPDTGINLLQERFKAEIYGDESLPDTKPDQGMPFQEPGSTPYIPEEQEEPGESAPEEEADGIDRDRVNPPKIPSRYQAPLVSENFAGQDNGAYIKYGAGFIKNDTSHEDEQVEEILEQAFSIPFEDTDEPQVLLIHTHATESFEQYDTNIYDSRNTWRSTDNNINMVAVGNAMQEVLEANGIGVIHDSTQHDHPSYNGSYERSAETIKRYLEEYPSIKVVLDLHRDGIQREDGSIVKPVAVIDGKKAAQIMIIAGCDDGTMNMPHWRENLRFAAAFQDYMEQYSPDLTRPVFFCYRKYNQNLTTGSLLLEFGSNANTLEEAVYSARLAGQALSYLIQDNTFYGDE